MADATETHSYEGAAVFVAPVGTAAPTDTTTAWGAGWTDLGFLSEDGVTRGMEHEVERFYGQHLDGVSLLKVGKHKFRPYFKFVALEDNDDIHALLNPDGTISDDLTTKTRLLSVPKSVEKAWGLELREGDTVKRLVFPRGTISEPPAERKHSAQDLDAVELTVDVFVASDGTFGSDLTLL